jgi:hypothetical protein
MLPEDPPDNLELQVDDLNARLNDNPRLFLNLDEELTVAILGSHSNRIDTILPIVKWLQEGSMQPAGKAIFGTYFVSSNRTGGVRWSRYISTLNPTMGD